MSVGTTDERLPRVALVSDTHVPRFARRLPRALECIEGERPTHVLHCGDYTTLAALAPLIAIAPFDGVAGNNDGPDLVERFGRRKIVAIGGARIGLIHGDGTSGTTASRARAAFAPGTVDIVVFGHSHVPSCTNDGGVWIVNPGSPTDKRRHPHYSFAMLEWVRDVCTPRLVFFR
ncbi:MAG: metallophosphoesterase family protein [Vulcanimicrobiaceae bacterium]